ncbi:MAG TPA: hypothetical protein VMV90_04125 [Rectinemataceae bacterium]|nr:hypothetical protein [Rectinemataceae bacterium]
MKDIQEARVWRINGFIALIAEAALGAVIWKFAEELSGASPLGLAALLLVFFGTYAGSARQAGFHWTNPLATRKAVSVRARNFNSEAIKVNDESGNPIEIGAVVNNLLVALVSESQAQPVINTGTLYA